jgi:hypothetical protein
MSLITMEDVRAVPLLKDIDENAVNAFIALGNNLHQQKISDYGKELKSKYEADVLELTKIPQNRGETAYDYLKRAFGEKSSSYESQIADLQSKLEKTGKSKGNDSAEYLELSNKYKDLETQYAELKADQDAIVSDYESKLLSKDKNLAKRIALAQFKEATSDLKPKAGTEAAFDELKELRLSRELDKYEIKLESTSDGDEVPRFYLDGKLVTDKANSREPHSARSLALEALRDLIAEDGKGGIGSNPRGSGSGDRKSFASTEVPRSKDEALSMAKNQLSSEGVSRNDPQYQEKLDALYTDAVALIEE